MSDTDVDNSVIYACDLDGTGSMHACSHGDQGATSYTRTDLTPQWQSIDTAPKDGSPVDMWCVRTHCHGEVTHKRVCDVRWGEMANQFTGKIYDGWIGLGEVYAELEPTHWMPLPPLPSD